MIDKIKRRLDYPRQFWVLFGGVFLNRISASMLWPFLTIYMVQQLDVPLATATLLLSVSAATSLIATTIVGSAMDRLGRKRLMVFSLVTATIVFAGMAEAKTLALWAILVAIHGAVTPIFSIGVNTMTADIVESKHRAPAYALIRMASNAGVAIGPVIGAILATRSFALMFYITGAAHLILAIFVALILMETLPQNQSDVNTAQPQPMGYGFILKDRLFLGFVVAYLFISMAYTQVFSLMPLYTAENFGLQEHEYSLFLTVNATMVVFMQYGITRITMRYNDFAMIALGAALYMIGTISVGLGSTLTHFIISMVIVTLGELVLTPTATTFIAERAPVQMRARYMSVLSISYPVAAGIGPVIGGYLNDTIAPAAIWYGAGMMAAIGMISFIAMGWYLERKKRYNSAVAYDI